MKTFNIVNSKQQNIEVALDTVSEQPTGTAMIMHGFGGFKEQKQVMAFTDAFLENNFQVLRIDATNANGKSDGTTKDATFDSYTADYEDVYQWAKVQDWFMEPLAVCGHSMGAHAAIWFAGKHVDEVSFLLPMAPVVNQQLYVSTKSDAEIQAIKERGVIELPSRSVPGKINYYSYDNFKSLERFDLTAITSKLTMPMLDIVGEKDDTTPTAHQQVLLDASASSDKTLVELDGLDHNYRSEDEDYDASVNRVTEVISKWLEKRIG